MCWWGALCVRVLVCVCWSGSAPGDHDHPSFGWCGGDCGAGRVRRPYDRAGNGGAVGGWERAMSWILGQIGAKRAELEGRLELLRKELMDVEDELSEVAAAERVVARIMADARSGPDQG